MTRDKEWSFEANLQRGYLPTGEPLEALYGEGWWTEEEEGPDQEWPVTQCPQCGGQAYIVSASNTSATTLDCENCGTIVVQEDE